MPLHDLPAGYEDPFLTISLDIDCDDPSTIQQCIAAARTKFNSAQSKDKIKYSALLAGLAEIESMLIDAGVRMQLREAVKAERAEARRRHTEAAERTAQGYKGKQSITKAEADTFVKTYKKPLGPTEDELLAMLPPVTGGGQPDSGKSAQAIAKTLPSVTMSDIQRKLKVVGRESLYAVVEMPKPVDPAQVDVQEINQGIAGGRAKCVHLTSGVATAMKDLLGYVSTILVDPAKRASYHASMRLADLEEVLSMIRVFISDGRLSASEYGEIQSLASGHGLDISELDELINAEAAKIKGGVIIERSSEPLPKQRLCGECQAMSPQSSVSCVRCKRSLDMTCPTCASKFPTEKGGCPSCGTTISDAMRMRGAIEEARKLVARGQNSAARKMMQEIAHLFPFAKMVEELKQELDGAAAGQAQILEQARQAVSETRLVAARSLLEKLSDASEIALQVRSLETQVSGALVEVAKLLAQARRDSGDAAAASLAKAAELCSDCDEVVSEARKYPPQPPSAAVARQQGIVVQVEFRASASSGINCYRLVRGVGKAPTSADDGDVIEVSSIAGPTITAVDASAPVGELLIYAVYAFRAGVPSRSAAQTPPALRTAPVNGLVARADDGSVRLEYGLPHGATRVLVSRSGGTGLKDVAAGSSGTVDSGVANGTAYMYTVTAVFRGPAGELLSEPVTATATPQRPPDPVTSLDLSFANGVVNASWPASKERVSIVRSAHGLGLKQGTVVSNTELAGFGSVLTASSSGTLQDRPDRAGVCYYTAFTLRDGIAVAGASGAVACVEDVTGLKASNRSGKVELSWEWPQGAVATILAWSSKSMPLNSNDPVGNHKSVDRQVYDRQGLVALEGLDSGQYYIKAFAVFQSGTTRVESSGTSAGSSATVFAGELPVLTYDLKSAGMFKKGYVLLIKGASGLVLPDLVVVVKSQFVPTDNTDGQTALRIPSITLNGGAMEVKLEGLPSGQLVRLFFADRSDNERMRMVHPPSERLKVK